MRNIIFKIINRSGITAALRKPKKDGITVLSFHRITPERDFFFDPIDPSLFEELIRYSLRHYHITSFRNLDQPSAKPKMILSFDDGYYDFMEYAVPILTKYDLPSNHNLVNACLDGHAVIWTQKLGDIFNHLKKNNITSNPVIDSTGSVFKNNWMAYYLSFFFQLLKLSPAERSNILQDLATTYAVNSEHRMMTWQDASDCMSKYNVEIGSHTYNHESLLSITDQQGLDKEIGRSVAEMESRLNTKINILAFPNGQYNDSVLAYAKTKGLKYILLHDDKITAEKELNDHFNLVSRVRLVNEGVDEAILRTELFHPKIRKII